MYLPTIQIARPNYLKGGQWILEGLNEVTVLFGRNGSGKSNLLRALRETDKKSFHYASPERGGEISFQMEYAQEELTATTRGSRRIANFAGQFRQEAISRIQSLFLKMGYLAASKKTVPIDLNDLENILSVLLPDFDFKVLPQNPPFSLTRISNGEKVASVSALSSGEAEALTLALDILTMASLWEIDAEPKRVMLLDEPDNHLHPDLQQHLARFLIEIVDKFRVQLLVATHSTTLLSALGYQGRERTSVIYLNNATEVQKATKFDKTLQELATCLGGHALMGPLFAAPLLLVEGDDDFRIWSQVPRYHHLKLAAIPCQGEEIFDYQKTLERLFSSIREATVKPLGYALLDGDKALPEPNEQNSQQHIKFVRLDCHESENLYLTNEVLASLGLTWETAIQKIKSRSPEYGQKQQKLNECAVWERKTADVKDVIRQIEEILDDKRVPWTMRVAKQVGSRKPEGQLADFLGVDLINAFWS